MAPNQNRSNNRDIRKHILQILKLEEQSSGLNIYALKKLLEFKHISSSNSGLKTVLGHLINSKLVTKEGSLYMLKKRVKKNSNLGSSKLSEAGMTVHKGTEPILRFDEAKATKQTSDKRKRSVTEENKDQRGKVFIEERKIETNEKAIKGILKVPRHLDDVAGQNKRVRFSPEITMFAIPTRSECKKIYLQKSIKNKQMPK